MSETTMQQSLFGENPSPSENSVQGFDDVPFFEEGNAEEPEGSENIVTEEALADPVENADEPETKVREEKKDENNQEPMPEFTGTIAEQAEQKLKWERAHLDDKKKDPSVYDSLLAMLNPADNDRVLTYLIEECRKDEALSAQVLLKHKSFKRCMKVFVDTFTQYFTAYGIANLQTAKIDGRDVPVGVATDEAGFAIVKGYYMLDDLEQVEKEKKEAEEKAKKEAENKKKLEEAKAKSKKKADKKDDKKTDKEEKKEDSFLFSLFD